MMPKAVPLLLLLGSSCYAATQIGPFEPAIPQLSFEQDPSDLRHYDLLRRADNCGSCAYIGQPNFCCKSNANCAVDGVGHVACCPVGSLCTGTISGQFATGSVYTGGDSGSTSNIVQGPMTTASLVPAAQSAGDYSIVSNPYYPFRAIPTTYADAAGCSAAWSGCQSDMAQCTAYLQGQSAPSGGGGGGGAVIGNGGVTISAPNGGVTVGGQTNTLAPASITMAPASASSICSSLSSQGCSGLQVTACSVFGGTNDAYKACGAYGAAVGGLAVGLAGQLLLM